MSSKQVLGALDYGVVGLSLLVSAVIGIKLRTSRGKDADGYILGGRDMAKLPVVMSISVTMLSSVTMMGIPMEVYRFGGQFIVILVPMVLGTVAVTVVFLPVYFRCEVSSIYEVFLMSVALYAPALALDAVTDMSLEMSIIVFGIVCTFYSSVGGLKGVLWTDVFQSLLIFFCLAAIYTQGVAEAGGVAEVYRRSAESGRLDLLNFSTDLTTRYTFLNVVCRGFISIISIFGSSQLEVQRMLSMRSLARARSALLWSLVPQVTLLFLCSCLGLVMYAVFRDCDPVADHEHSGIRRHDQVIPFYIASRFGRYPGLTGLCVAGLFSGSLSTVSSVLNSLSTVTLVDFVRPVCARLNLRMPEGHAVLLAKALALFYGGVCIGFAFTLRGTSSVAAVSTTLVSILEGPVIAVFAIGVLSRKGSEKCILSAVVLGVSFTGWIAFGSMYRGYVHPQLPLSTAGCAGNHSSSTAGGGYGTPSPPHGEKFSWFKTSYQWYTPIGFVSTLVFSALAILISGRKFDVIPEDSKCLSPVTRYWTRKRDGETKPADQQANSSRL